MVLSHCLVGSQSLAAGQLSVLWQIFHVEGSLHQTL